MDLKTWFQKQYVTEAKTRMEYEQTRTTKLGMVAGWRCSPNISVWAALPGEALPTQWNKKTLVKDAREAWERCDKSHAQLLYNEWNHVCTDPYYCPMHGWGSD